jgi:ATP adenylyltransferase
MSVLQPIRRSHVFFAGDQVLGLWDAFPVSPGHALLIPRRHIPTWFEATAAEHVGLVAAIDEAKEIIEKHHRPDGYNIGINCGAAAGQTVFHLHVHLIPRYQGDVGDPRGGVRHVIAAKANYLSRSGSRSDDSTSQ